MQRPESPERKLNKTPPSIITNQESQCNNAADGTPGGQKVRRYASRQIFLGHEDVEEAQTCIDAPTVEVPCEIQMTKRRTQDHKQRTKLG